MKTPPTKAAINMRMIAQRAGVSNATVSRVINNSSLVKEKTANHVRSILEELNFIPNPVATTLKYGRSNTYGLIVPDLHNPFYPEFLFHFEEALIESDFELLLATTQSSTPKLKSSVRRMLMRHVDGVVMMASEFDTRSIEPLFERKIPIVTIDRRHAQPGTGDVAITFEEGYRQAVYHLRELGHKRIAFIGGSEGIRTSQVRLEAFQKALQDVELTYYPKLVRYGDYRVDGGDTAMRSLLLEARRPTAVMTANDLTAFGAIRALHSSGVSVPSEMSVIGFDGIQLGNAIHPALTTISVSHNEMARACLKVLSMIKANPTKRGPLLRVDASLIFRESTAVPPATTKAPRALQPHRSLNAFKAPTAGR
jgi:LacI family transcriptional regulator